VAPAAVVGAVAPAAAGSVVAAVGMQQWWFMRRDVAVVGPYGGVPSVLVAVVVEAAAWG
jgi:hypothetical protein